MFYHLLTRPGASTKQGGAFMKEPLNIRLSTSTNPARGKDFERILIRRRASAAAIMRGLVDAYIESDGVIDYPWRLVSAQPKKKS